MKYQLISIFNLLVAIFLLTSCKGTMEERYEVSSPDGNLIFEVYTEAGQLFYAVSSSGENVFEPSRLGLRFKQHSSLGEDITVIKGSYQSNNSTWEQPWGEKRLIEDRNEEMLLELQENGKEGKTLNLRVKVFNDGFGFRYEVPKQDGVGELVIMDEITEFKLPTIDDAWWTAIYNEEYYEAITQNTPINEMDTVCLPLTIETKGGKFLVIHEANLSDYAAMNLYCADSTTLTCDLTPWSTGEKVFTQAPFVSPWRMVIVADKPGDLITSHIELNLNEPCKIEDTGWIEPGKYIGIWWGMHMGKYTWHMGPNHGATTDITKKYIDFAANHGFKGVLVEGWNVGWENDWTKEGDKFKFTTPYPDFDIEYLSKYAQKKGVRLIGHHETGGATLNYEQQLDEAFKFYSELGIRSVKTGYVGARLDGKERHSSQYGIRHFRKVIETAAKYKIAIDQHEPAMPSGLRRTFPNLMTGEGVRGQEYNAWSSDGGNKPEHLTIIPFTRGLAGPIDFTPGVFNFDNPINPETRVNTTIAKQLALYVIIYSPLQMAADLPENYTNHSALKFIEDVPVNWDLTKVLDAKIGDYITTVRKDRDSDEWFLGSITDENSRLVDVDLTFLDQDKKYKAEIYRDGTDADYKVNPTSYKIETKYVTSRNTLVFKLAKSGGVAIRFIPVL